MILDHTAARLKRHKVENAYLDAINLIRFVTKQADSKIITGDLEISRAEERELDKLISRRKSLPLAYLTNKKEFYGLDFYVDRSVLIPRPASEDIVSLSLGLKKHFDYVYDLGCGSGCLAISYLLHSDYQPLRTFLIDKSRSALEVTKINLDRYQLSNYRLINMDLNLLEPGCFRDRSLVFANLPYVDLRHKSFYESKYPGLKAEPEIALYGREGGLQLYRKLFKLVGNHRLTLAVESQKKQQARLDGIARANNYRLLERSNLVSLYRKD